MRSNTKSRVAENGEAFNKARALKIHQRSSWSSSLPSADVHPEQKTHTRTITHTHTHNHTHTHAPGLSVKHTELSSCRWTGLIMIHLRLELILCPLLWNDNNSHHSHTHTLTRSLSPGAAAAAAGSCGRRRLQRSSMINRMHHSAGEATDCSFSRELITCSLIHWTGLVLEICLYYISYYIIILYIIYYISYKSQMIRLVSV